MSHNEVNTIAETQKFSKLSHCNPNAAKQWQRNHKEEGGITMSKAKKRSNTWQAETQWNCELKFKQSRKYYYSIEG